MSPVEVVLLVAVVAMAAVIAVLLFRRRSDISAPGSLPEGINAEVSTMRQRLALPAGGTPVFAAELTSADLVPGQPIIVADPMDQNQIIVLGGDEAAAALGDVIGPIPGQMAGMLVGADAMVKAGIAVGEQSGVLVRIAGDSAKALREGRKVYDTSGKLLAVVQDANGKFMHVLRIQPLKGVQALSAGTGALSAIAMQAQMAAIEKKLEEVLDGVRDIQASIDRHEQAQLDGMERTLNDIYQGARTSGVLTQSAWDQLAPLRKFIDEHHVNAELKVKALVEELTRQKSTGDRRGWLRTNGPKLEKALAQLAQAERSLIQFEALRAWWLALTDDASAGHYAEQLRTRLDERRRNRGAIEEATLQALESARETWAWDFVHSPWDSSKVETQAVRLRNRLTAEGLLGTIPAIERGEHA
jgi:hypothetical protein